MPCSCLIVHRFRFEWGCFSGRMNYPDQNRDFYQHHHIKGGMKISRHREWQTSQMLESKVFILCLLNFVINPVPVCVCALYLPLITGGLQIDLPHVSEGWLLQLVEGQLCHHGASHPICCHPVLCPWAIQEAARRLLWLPGQVSGSLFSDLLVARINTPDLAFGRQIFLQELHIKCPFWGFPCLDDSDYLINTLDSVDKK